MSMDRGSGRLRRFQRQRPCQRRRQSPGHVPQLRLKAERFASGPVVADPVSLFDAAPLGDGSAAVIVTKSDRAMDMVPKPVQIIGSALATDHIGLHDRKDILRLRAAELERPGGIGTGRHRPRRRRRL